MVNILSHENIDMKIDCIKEEHWNGILKVQNDVYLEVAPESIEVVKSKWLASPETCLVYLSKDEVVSGYLLSHPWDYLHPPKLFKELSGEISGNYLYLHDLAVDARLKGRGIGKKLLNSLIKIATRKLFKKITLVAVQGSNRFWSKAGFKEHHGVKVPHSYGENSVFMEMEL